MNTPSQTTRYGAAALAIAALGLGGGPQAQAADTSASVRGGKAICSRVWDMWTRRKRSIEKRSVWSEKDGSWSSRSRARWRDFLPNEGAISRRPLRWPSARLTNVRMS